MANDNLLRAVVEIPVNTPVALRANQDQKPPEIKVEECETTIVK